MSRSSGLPRRSVRGRQPYQTNWRPPALAPHSTSVIRHSLIPHAYARLAPAHSPCGDELLGAFRQAKFGRDPPFPKALGLANSGEICFWQSFIRHGQAYWVWVRSSAKIDIYAIMNVRSIRIGVFAPILPPDPSPSHAPGTPLHCCHRVRDIVSRLGNRATTGGHMLPCGIVRGGLCYRFIRSHWRSAGLARRVPPIIPPCIPAARAAYVHSCPTARRDPTHQEGACTCAQAVI